MGILGPEVMQESPAPGIIQIVHDVVKHVPVRAPDHRGEKIATKQNQICGAHCQERYEERPVQSSIHPAPTPESRGTIRDCRLGRPRTPICEMEPGATVDLQSPGLSPDRSRTSILDV